MLVGNAAFANAREPLAQAFKAEGAPDAEAFAVVVNHFKSKSDSRAHRPTTPTPATARAPTTATGRARPPAW